MNQQSKAEKNRKLINEISNVKLFKTLNRYGLTFLISVAVPVVVGLISALLIRGNTSVYDELLKPPLAPPPIVFPLVWTVLYVLMGICFALVLINRTPDNVSSVAEGVRLYILSLILNFGWSIVFFNLRQLGASFVLVIGLLLTVAKTAVSYHKIYPPAAWLQLPYILWLLFATYLNAFYLIVT